MAGPRILIPAPFVRKRIKRVAFCGNSRFAAGPLNATANYTGRAGSSSMTPLFNIAAGGRAVAVNPGELHTTNNASVSAATSTARAQWGFSIGSLGYDGLMGVFRNAIKQKVDCMIFEPGYNDLTATGTITTQAINRMRYTTAWALESGVPYIVLCTCWGPGNKDADAIAAYNVAVREQAATLGDRCILYDTADAWSQNSDEGGTYSTPGESPGVHFSVLGQDTWMAGLIAVLDPYMAQDYRGFPILETSYSYLAEAAVLYNNQFSTWGFGGGGPNANSQAAGDGIVANGTVTTSAQGTVSSATATSTACGGNRMTLNLLTGAMAYSFVSGYQVALTTSPAVGDRIAIAFGFEVNGLITGNSYANLLVKFGTNTSGANSATVTVASHLQTNAYLGTRGLGYAEFTAAQIYTHMDVDTEITQADNLANLTAGAYSGSMTLDNFTIVNLSALARATNY